MIVKSLTILLVVLGIAGLIVVWVIPAGSYHYVGLEQMDVTHAKQLQVEQNSGDNNIQITAYNESSDKIYVSYNFYGDEDDYLKYGIPQGDYDVDYEGSAVATMFIVFFIGLAIFLECAIK